MQKDRRIFKNIAALLSRDVLNKGGLFFVSLFIARLLGRDSLGEYFLALTIVNIIFFIVELGMNTFLIREVARKKEMAGKYLFNFSLIQLFSGLFGLLLIFVVSRIMRCSAELTRVNLVCGLSYFVVGFINLQSCLFRAFEKMKYEFFASLIKNLFFLSAAIFLLFKGATVLGVFNLFLVANILALVAMSMYIRKEGIRYDCNLDFSEYPVYIRATMPLWLAQIFEIIFLRIASPLLYVFKGAEAVGLYNAGYIVFAGAYTIASGIVMAIFPVLSSQYMNAREEFIKTYRKWLANLIYIFAPLLLISILLADKLIGWSYGVKFQSSVPAFRVLAGAAFFGVLNIINYITLVSMNRQRQLVLIMGGGMALNLLLCIRLIPVYDFYGAALSLLINEAAVLLALLFAVNSNIVRRKTG